MDKKTEALERAIQIAGGQSDLKRRLTEQGRPVSQQSISLWRRAGQVASGWALPVARAVNFAVTPHELDDVAYPNPWDGLPFERARPLLLELAA